MRPDIQVAGSGPRVLLIQGTGIAGRAWAPQVEALQHSYRVAWYDAPGMGDRPGWAGSVAMLARDAAATMDDLGWSSAIVAGHSLGGVVAQQLAVQAPERVRGLALLCTFAQGWTSLGLWPPTALIQLRTSIGTASMRRRAFYELVTHPDWPANDANIEALERVFGRPLHALPLAAMAQVGALVRAGLRRSLSTLSMPAVVVAGEHDRLASVGQGRRLAKVLDAPLHVLDGGHALPIQQAGAVNAVLLEAFASWRA